jgi:polar amino acid transport system permease protein
MLPPTISNNLDLFAQGLWVTTQVCVIAFGVALLFGVLLCLVRLYFWPLRWLAILIIEFCRNTPIYVQLLWVNYVWPDLFGWPNSFFTAGWTALALQSSGYLAETFRSGIEGISKGHVEAAQSLGMSQTQTIFRILLPQAILTMAPSIMNQFLIAVKSSTLVSVIAVPDLMYQALRLTSIWFEPIEILSFTAFLYIAIIFALSQVFKQYADMLNRRYGVSGFQTGPL